MCALFWAGALLHVLLAAFGALAWTTTSNAQFSYSMVGVSVGWTGRDSVQPEPRVVSHLYPRPSPGASFGLGCVAALFGPASF